MSLPRSLNEIQQRVRDGEEFDFLFFWGHQVPKDGSVNKSCLSQWYPAPFEVGDIVYPTAKHWMMAEKARLFTDHDTLKRILAAPNPKEAKALGRDVDAFNVAVWNDACRGIVRRGNSHKFAQNEEMREYLPPPAVSRNANL